LVSICVIGLELALMRMLSLRFWHHFAGMVISVALLGFGASGTVIALLRRRLGADRRAWLCRLSFALAIGAPLCTLASKFVPLNAKALAWDYRQGLGVLAVESLMFVPFLLGGLVVGVALTDRPERLSGHYAASLIGSGVGAALAVGMLHGVGFVGLIFAMASLAAAAGVVMMRGRTLANAVVICAVAAWLIAMAAPALTTPAVSQYKMLPYALSTPGAKTLHTTSGPMGRIDLVRAPGIHHSFASSVQWHDPPPPHVLAIVDGGRTHAVYDCRRRENWRFTDYSTAAVAYHLRPGPRVCIVPAGGGAQVGLARLHDSRRIVAVAPHPQLIETITTVLADRGGSIYLRPEVRVEAGEPRGYFLRTGESFDIVQVAGAGGASEAGLAAAQESYLYTVESVEAMLGRLGQAGLLCVTCPADVPPRQGLRTLDTVAEALRRTGRRPAEHLAMIRSSSEVTVLAGLRPLAPGEIDQIRVFCAARDFDLCALPGMTAPPTGRSHLLQRPYYFHGAAALLGERRREYLDDYAFNVEAVTDDRPYFHHFFRWRSLGLLTEQLGQRSRAFLEVGYLLLAAALAQAVLLAVVLLLLPLASRVGGLRGVSGKAGTLGYFALLGAGFMMLEMAFLQRLILYLADPIHSAAAVIASFLVFAGLGSLISRRWRGSPKRVAGSAAAAIVCMALAEALVMDRWLALTQSRGLWLRFVIAAATIAPLATAMGHMFPTGLRQVSLAGAPLVPWAWAVNGFASVAAAVAAPLVAMHFGFTRLALAAVACYAGAGLLAAALPRGELTASPSRTTENVVPSE